MKGYKRVVSILMIALMVVGIVPFTTSADTVQKTQADSFVASAEMCIGRTREGVKAKIRSMGKTPWYESWYYDWCAWFVTNAARTAEIPTSIIPNLTICDRAPYQSGRYGVYHRAKYWGGSYVPRRGDILYFDFDGDNISDHTGIVRFVKNGRVYTVEGNFYGGTIGGQLVWKNAVIFRNYSQNNSNIRGYSTPRFGPIDNSFVYRYNANGGAGSMKDTKVRKYGTKTTLRKNTFTRKGYVFTGWNLYRKSDGKWWYKKSNTEYGWYENGSEPAGYTKGLWADKKVTNGNNTYVDNDVITLYAVWKKESEVENSKIWKRIYGSNRYDTMKSIISTGFKNQVNTVIVASGNTYKDAVAASGFAGLFNAPLILTTSKSLSKQAEDMLKSFKPKNVYIVGGTMAVSNGVKNKIASVTGVTPVRLGGHTSSGTSAKLALEGENQGLWSKDKIGIVATNSSFKDALSISPVAYVKKYPVFLADNGKMLSEEVISAMKKLEITKVIIVGGEKAVSENVVNQLKTVDITVFKRLAGDTGTKTSRKIANWALDNGLVANRMGIATSQDFPDALAGGILCGKYKSVLLLCDDEDMYNSSYPKAHKATIKRGLIFGGQTAVGLKTYKALDKSTS